MENQTLASIFLSGQSESGLSRNQSLAVNIANNVATGLSLFGVAYYFFLSSKLKNKTFILILITNLMASDLLYSFSNLLINFDSNDAVCRIEGLFRQYSQISTLFWAVSLAFSAFAQTIYNITNLQKHYWIMKLIGFGFPFVLSIIPFIPISSLEYGNMGTHCWIIGRKETNLPLWVCTCMLLAYIWIAIILVTYWYLRIYLFMRNVNQTTIYTRRLFVYPIVLLISFVPVVIDRFLSTTSLMFISAMFHMMTQHLNGFLNAITYGIQTAKNIQKANRISNQTSRPSHKDASKGVNLNIDFSTQSPNNYENTELIRQSLTNSLRQELLLANENSECGV